MIDKEALLNEKESVACALTNAWEYVWKKLEEWQDHTEPSNFDSEDYERITYENGLRTGTINGLMMAMDFIEIEQQRERAAYQMQIEKMELESPLLTGNPDV